LRPLTEGPSARDANALVDLPKFITRMPPVRVRAGSLRIIATSVYDSSGRRTGLKVDAHVSLPTRRGRHGETPQVALVWRGECIRRIDWEVCHEFADGLTVAGWHEHLWDDVHGSECGRTFQPPLGAGSDLQEMFICACHHWNITVRTRQDQHLREEDR